MEGGYCSFPVTILLISDGFFLMGSEGFEVLCRSQKRKERNKKSLENREGMGIGDL